MFSVVWATTIRSTEGDLLTFIFSPEPLVPIFSLRWVRSQPQAGGAYAWESQSETGGHYDSSQLTH